MAIMARFGHGEHYRILPDRRYRMLSLLAVAAYFFGEYRKNLNTQSHVTDNLGTREHRGRAPANARHTRSAGERISR